MLGQCLGGVMRLVIIVKRAAIVAAFHMASSTGATNRRVSWTDNQLLGLGLAGWR